MVKNIDDLNNEKVNPAIEFGFLELYKFVFKWRAVNAVTM